MNCDPMQEIVGGNPSLTVPQGCFLIACVCVHVYIQINALCDA